MSEEMFEARFPLQQNHLNPNASWDGCLFETFGEEVEFVAKQDPSTVWTLVEDGEGGECIMSGFHFVNRLGFLLSTVPVPEGTAIEVQITGAELPDDEADNEDIGESDDRDRPTMNENDIVLNHEHEWVVFSTAINDCCLMLQCVKCGMMATVDDPSREEWNRAFYSPSRPYRWSEEARVRVQHEPPCPFYVVRTEKAAPTCDCPPKVPDNGEWEYERFPAEIIRPDEAMTDEDVAELEQLAKLVGESDLCSRFFPFFIQSFQNATGQETTGAVKRIAASIEKMDRMGLHCMPQVVARVLREYIKASRINHEEKEKPE